MDDLSIEFSLWKKKKIPRFFLYFSFFFFFKEQKGPLAWDLITFRAKGFKLLTKFFQCRPFSNHATKKQIEFKHQNENFYFSFPKSNFLIVKASANIKKKKWPRQDTIIISNNIVSSRIIFHQSTIIVSILYKSDSFHNNLFSNWRYYTRAGDIALRERKMRCEVLWKVNEIPELNSNWSIPLDCLSLHWRTSYLDSSSRRSFVVGNSMILKLFTYDLIRFPLPYGRSEKLPPNGNIRRMALPHKISFFVHQIYLNVHETFFYLQTHHPFLPLKITI